LLPKLAILSRAGQVFFECTTETDDNKAIYQGTEKNIFLKKVLLQTNRLLLRQGDMFEYLIRPGTDTSKPQEGAILGAAVT
ncbi:hypothetical protein ACJX0J_016885, partial [Zea mays]